MNGGNDQITLYPHDLAGQLTINGNLGVGGGTESDALTVDDSGSGLPIGYSFFNQFGPSTTNIGGLGAALLGAGSDVESITVTGGGGDDTFDINTFQSGSALAINGGWGGSDTVNFGVTNLPSEITSIASFHFDGQSGFDTLNVNNFTHPNAFTYIANAGLSVFNAFGASYFLTHPNVESLKLNAGPQGDLFYIDVVAPSSSVVINGGAGLDGLLMGSGNTLDSIQGPVFYHAQADGGNLAVIDTADTTGDIVHQTATTLGAHAGDTLFPSGGSLTFSDLVNFGAFPGITLNLGSGADTVFAQPLPAARVTVNGGNPASAPGDNFRLSLAGVSNPVFTPNGTGAGTYTFGNAAAVNYTGIETASTYIPGDYSGNGIVGPEDYTVWRASYGMAVAPGTLGDGIVDAADYVVWRKNLGAVAPAGGASLAAEESSVVVTSGGPAVTRAADITSPGIASLQSLSGNALSIASFTAVGKAQPGDSSDERPGLPRRTIAPTNYDGRPNRVVDLAYDEFDAKHRSLSDDDLAAVAAGIRDGDYLVDPFDSLADRFSAELDAKAALRTSSN